MWRLLLTVIFFILGADYAAYAQQSDTLNLNGTVTIKQGDQPQSVTGNAILDSVLTAIISGTVIVAIIGGAYGYLTKKRDQQAAEIAKEKEHFIKISADKITATSSMVPLYTASASYHNSLQDTLRAYLEDKTPTASLDAIRVLFYFCNILSLRNQIMARGDFQLCDLDAEDIVSNNDYVVMGMISSSPALGYIHVSILRSLVYDEATKTATPYFKFHQELTGNPSRYQAYEKWIENISRTDLESIAQSSEWTAKLLIFELNHIYSVYYGGEPDPSKSLPEELYKHIETKYSNYYKKLKKIEDSLPKS